MIGLVACMNVQNVERLRSQRNHDQMLREWQKILLLLKHIGNASRQIMRTGLLLSSSEPKKKNESESL